MPLALLQELLRGLLHRFDPPEIIEGDITALGKQSFEQLTFAGLPGAVQHHYRSGTG